MGITIKTVLMKRFRTCSFFHRLCGINGKVDTEKNISALYIYFLLCFLLYVNAHQKLLTGLMYKYEYVV